MLFESKRDDMLFPYLRLLQNNGIDINMGQFKSKLLNKLSFEGGITNLSLRSNYYLAGTARYYFNGDLTTNKDVSLLNRASYEGNGSVQDNWNVDVCKKVNALINVLRDAYIDSVGTEMLEPEDFGVIPLAKLFRKYNKLIMKELGIVAPNKKKSENQVELDMNENVGNGYTFEIMYSYKDCEKYKIPTSPGAWCITYRQRYYNDYLKNLNIHYVIFRKNGWENVQRPKNPLEAKGFTPKKPHDAYGNSLIALLQSNLSPEPVYITSRWNHGYEVRCEADHAYTKEEFERITGISDEDLKRIYQIWRLNKNKRHVTPSKNREKMLGITRRLKYIQMRVNSGENIQTLIKVMSEPLFGGTLKNGIYIGGLANENENLQDPVENLHINAQFIVDRGQIVFDSVVIGNGGVKQINMGYVRCGYPEEKKIKLYHSKSHSFVNVDGCTQFKYTPKEFYDDAEYAELKQTKEKCVLLDVANGKPLQLPNGQFWVNSVISNSYYSSYTTACNQYGTMNCSLLEITYDLSSGEKYFYNLNQKKYIQVPSYDEIGLPIRSPWVDKLQVSPTVMFNGNGYYGIAYRTNNGFMSTDTAAFNKDGKRFRYKSLKGFREVMVPYNAKEYLILVSYIGDWSYYNTQRKKCLGLIDNAGILSLNGEPIKFHDTKHIGEYVLFQLDAYGTFFYIFSLRNKALLINPYANEHGDGTDSKYKFNVAMAADAESGSVIMKLSDEMVTREEWLKIFDSYNDNGTIDNDKCKIVSLDDIYDSGYHVPAQFLSDDNTQETQQAVNEVVNVSLDDIKIMTESVLRKILLEC